MELHNYIESLIKPIQSQEVKLAVAEEIKGHIEEQKEAYMEEGMDEKAALEQAILSMGSPKEVGDAFATIYNLTSEKKNMIYYSIFSLLGLALIWCLRTLDTYTVMIKIVGVILMLGGVIAAASEKWANLSFYYFKNQSGGSTMNSYAICAAGIAFFSEEYWQWLILSVIIGLVVYFERDMIEKCQAKKTDRYLYKTGIAITDIDYRGKANIDGEVQKVRVTHDKIKKGQNVIISKVNGFHLIVEAISP